MGVLLIVILITLLQRRLQGGDESLGGRQQPHHRGLLGSVAPAQQRPVGDCRSAAKARHGWVEHQMRAQVGRLAVVGPFASFLPFLAIVLNAALSFHTWWPQHWRVAQPGHVCIGVAESLQKGDQIRRCSGGLSQRTGAVPTKPPPAWPRNPPYLPFSRP